MIILNLAAAFAVALLCGLGVGGGGLFIVYLTLAVGMGQLEAQGINLIFFIAAGAASLALHIKKRGLRLKNLLLLSLCGLVGAAGGSLSTLIINPDMIRMIFGAALIITGGVILFKPHEKADKK